MWQTCCKKQKVNIQMFKKVLAIQNKTFNNKFSLIWEKDGLNSNLFKIKKTPNLSVGVKGFKYFWNPFFKCKTINLIRNSTTQLVLRHTYTFFTWTEQKINYENAVYDISYRWGRHSYLVSQCCRVSRQSPDMNNDAIFLKS